MSTEVTTTIADRVARLRLGAAPPNILTSALQNELKAALNKVYERKDFNLLLIESAHEVFSAGADVGEHLGRKEVETMLSAAHGLIETLLASPVPTLCCIRGACLGGAFELALACDMVIATEGARLGLPEITLGCYAPAGMVLVPQKLPAMLGSESVLSGRIFTGNELALRGAAFETVKEDRFDEAVASACQRFSALARGPLVEATRLYRSGAAERFRAAVGSIEKAYTERLLTLRDAEEGAKAFLAKREPVWDHKEVE